MKRKREVPLVHTGWRITERGVREIAARRGRDPDEEVRLWRIEQKGVRLEVVTGTTMLRAEDAENVAYSTSQGVANPARARLAR